MEKLLSLLRHQFAIHQASVNFLSELIVVNFCLQKEICPHTEENSLFAYSLFVLAEASSGHNFLPTEEEETTSATSKGRNVHWNYEECLALLQAVEVVLPQDCGKKKTDTIWQPVIDRMSSHRSASALKKQFEAISQNGNIQAHVAAKDTEKRSKLVQYAKQVKQQIREKHYCSMKDSCGNKDPSKEFLKPPPPSSNSSMVSLSDQTGGNGRKAINPGATLLGGHSTDDLEEDDHGSNSQPPVAAAAPKKKKRRTVKKDSSNLTRTPSKSSMEKGFIGKISEFLDRMTNPALAAATTGVNSEEEIVKRIRLEVTETVSRKLTKIQKDFNNRMEKRHEEIMAALRGGAPAQATPAGEQQQESSDSAAE